MKTPVKSSKVIKRREILKAMASLPFVGSLAFAGTSQPGYGSFEEINLLNSGIPGGGLKPLDRGVLEQIKGKIPLSKIKELDISRVIMGGNLFGGWAHSRDLMYVSELVKAYHTDDRIFQTLQMAEQSGINSLITNPILIPVMQKYWKLGGKVQFISDGGWNYRSDIPKSIDAGAAACFFVKRF